MYVRIPRLVASRREEIGDRSGVIGFMNRRDDKIESYDRDKTSLASLI